MAVLLSALILFAITGHSSAASCVCKDGVSQQVLQKAIDYACGNGADCTQIQTNGACYQPNTLKNHCDYAVNNYYQKKAASGATCEFSGAATLTNSPVSSSCGSSTGSGTGTPTTGTPTTGGTPATGTPSTGTPSTGTPSTGTPTTGTPSTGTPSTGTPSTGTPSTGTPTTGTPSTGTPTTTGTPTMGTPSPTTGTPSVFPGTTMGPTGSGFDDPSHGIALVPHTTMAAALSALLLPILAMLWV